MKKYLLTIFISLLIGFLLSNFVLRQYEDYKGITVYKEGTLLYFIEYGIFNNYNEMEANTINLENYVYEIKDNKYYVYIGITKNKEVLEKVNNYFKSLGYITNTKEFNITNDKFIEAIDNNDNVLLLTNDNIVIGEVISQGLTTYEEVTNYNKSSHFLQKS